MSKPRQIIRTEDIVQATGYNPQTVRRHIREGLYDLAKIGKRRPYIFNREKVEKQLGLTPGALA